MRRGEFVSSEMVHRLTSGSRLYRQGIQYTVNMRARLIAIALLLVTVLQVPGLAYSATLNGGVDQSSHACDARSLPDGQNCDSCCSHGLMPSCGAQCPAPIGAAVPLRLPDSLRIAVLSVIISDAGVAPFAEHNPPHLLRPPIV
jgi:hypothetical protein